MTLGPSRRDDPKQLAINQTSGLFHTTTPEDFLPPMGIWTSVGGLVLVAIFGTGVALSTVLKYKVTEIGRAHV